MRCEHSIEEAPVKSKKKNKVDRAYTMIWQQPTADSRKRGKIRKNYKQMDNAWRVSLWKRFLVVLKE